MKRTLLLSAGHSGKDPGACAFGRKEADIAVEMRNMVSYYLHSGGCDHAVDATGTDNVPLAVAVQQARRADIAIEFHCNANEDPRASGVECLQAKDDEALARALCAAVAGALKIPNRGAKPENSGQHKRLAFVQAGGVIVELFFLTNRGDLRAWDERKWVAARAVATVLAGAAAGTNGLVAPK